MNDSSQNWRAFWSLLGVQSLNAFNEKGTQFLLIPLGAALLGQATTIEYTLGALILLPYLLFSPLVGWISDYYSKARVIQWMLVVQVLVMLGIWGALRAESLNAAVALFGVFAVQATFFSPAKKGIVKDILGEKSLGFASGLMEMCVVLALLLGQIGVFVWFDSRYKSGIDPWSSASFPLMVMALLAIPLSLFALLVPRYEPLERRPFRASLFFEHFGQLCEMWRHKKLRYSEMGIAYFWFFGGAILYIVLEIAKTQTAGGAGYGHYGAMLMGWLSGGIVAGGVLISCLSLKKIHLKASFWGVAGMVLSCLALAHTPLTSAFFQAWLFCAGASASFLLVPLNAYFQDTSENSKRGSMIAAGNFCDMFLSLIAVGIQFLWMSLGISTSVQFILLAILSVLVYFLSLEPLFTEKKRDKKEKMSCQGEENP